MVPPHCCHTYKSRAISRLLTMVHCKYTTWRWWRGCQSPSKLDHHVSGNICIYTKQINFTLQHKRCNIIDKFKLTKNAFILQLKYFDTIYPLQNLPKHSLTLHYAIIKYNIAYLIFSTKEYHHNYNEVRFPLLNPCVLYPGVPLMCHWPELLNALIS